MALGNRSGFPLMSSLYVDSVLSADYGLFSRVDLTKPQVFPVLSPWMAAGVVIAQQNQEFKLYFPEVIPEDYGVSAAEWESIPAAVRALVDWSDIPESEAVSIPMPKRDAATELFDARWFTAELQLSSLTICASYTTPHNARCYRIEASRMAAIDAELARTFLKPIEAARLPEHCVGGPNPLDDNGDYDAETDESL